MIKSYKIRLNPTPDQEKLLWSHVHTARFIWNWALGYQQEYYKSGGKYLSAFSMSKLLTQLKNSGYVEWLKDVSSHTLRRVLLDQDIAYKMFFNKIRGYPKFKYKDSGKSSFPVHSENMNFSPKGVRLERLGRVAFQTNYKIPEGTNVKFWDARIRYVNSKWILTFGLKCESQTLDLTEIPLGIDLGVKDLAVVAFGDTTFKFPNINKSARVRKLTKKLKHLQRVISRKYEVSNKLHPHAKWQKTKLILKYEMLSRKVYAKLHNIRFNYIHQITHTLVSYLPKVVGMEDLNVMGMMKNKHLSRAIQEQCFAEFIRQMKYKCEYYGIQFVQAPRFYPSSKTCSHCNNIKKDLKLSDRTYTCTDCGTVFDRDYNAAINLMRYAESLSGLAA